jgi:hypothetical protein
MVPRYMQNDFIWSRYVDLLTLVTIEQIDFQNGFVSIRSMLVQPCPSCYAW